MANNTTSDTATPEQRNGAAAIILTYDGRILLQERDDYERAIGRFGGGRDSGDVDYHATIIRELKEELGAVVKREDLVYLTEVTGTHLNGTYGTTVTFFWSDSHRTITGCYEGAPAYFDSAATVLAHPDVRSHTKECVQIALKKGLIP